MDQVERRQPSFLLPFCSFFPVPKQKGARRCSTRFHSCPTPPAPADTLAGSVSFCSPAPRGLLPAGPTSSCTGSLGHPRPSTAKSLAGHGLGLAEVVTTIFISPGAPCSPLEDWVGFFPPSFAMR